MRVTPDQLVANPARHGGEIKAAGLLGHARVKHHLEQQIAELIAQPIQVAASDGIGNLIGLLDRERRDADKILLPIPRAAGLRIAKGAHQPQECFQFATGLTQVASSPKRSRRCARMPAVAPQMLYGPKDNSQVSTST